MSPQGGVGRPLHSGVAARLMRSDYSYQHGSWRYRGDYNRYSGDGWFGRDYPYYGEYWSPFGYYYDDYSPQPEASVAMPVLQMPMPPSPPPPTAVPVVHGYSWRDSGDDSGTTFAIASKDGTVQPAIAVWVQDGRLYFITPDGISRQLSMDEVDRQSTSRMNSGQKLKLLLPT
jgi:hypothetical protein